MKNLIPVITLLLTSNLSWALVDYSTSSSEEIRPQRSSTTVVQKKRKSPNVSSKKSSNNRNGFQSDFLVDLGINSRSITIGDRKESASTYNVNLMFATNYNIFIEAKYWYGKTDFAALSESSEMQKGNPTFKVGFNWLELGAPEEKVQVDFLAGMRLSGDSDFATQRSDKIVGIETKKFFYSFVMGLAYELAMTGDTKSNDQMDIGNIQKLTLALGWQATPDIRFLAETSQVKIGQGDNENYANALNSKDSFGNLKVKVLLGLSPLVDLNLGASFRTKKSSNDLVDARLWDYEAAYGNSIFSSLSISI